MATIDYGVGAPVYIVTEDVPQLIAHWAGQRLLVAPEPEFLRLILEELAGEIQAALYSSGIQANVQVLGYRGMRTALANRLRWYRDHGFVTVLFDRVYFPTDTGLRYSPTRAVLWQGGGWQGQSYQVAKAGTPPLALQAEAVARFWRSACNESMRVLVADDGVFEGASARRFFRELLRCGVPGDVLGSVLGGISLERFIEQSEEDGARLAIDAVHAYPSTGPEVIDWVCQRDFFAGVPQSGRAVISAPGDAVALQENGQPLSAPYWFGSGSLSWASIPDSAAEVFTRACARLTNRVYVRSAELSGRGSIRCGELAQLPAGICFDPNTLEHWEADWPFSTALDAFLQRTFGSSCRL